METPKEKQIRLVQAELDETIVALIQAVDGMDNKTNSQRNARLQIGINEIVKGRRNSGKYYWAAFLS